MSLYPRSHLNTPTTPRFNRLPAQSRWEQEVATRASPEPHGRRQLHLSYNSPRLAFQNLSHISGSSASPCIPQGPQPPPLRARRDIPPPSVVQQQLSIAISQSPASASSTRAPDRSLPLLEEDEDDDIYIYDGPGGAPRLHIVTNMQNSSSYEPIAPPTPLRPHISGRDVGTRPLPGVGSSQPRDTSPEPSSAEEMAGGDIHSTPRPRRLSLGVDSPQPRDTSPEPSSSGEEATREDIYPTHLTPGGRDTSPEPSSSGEENVNEYQEYEMHEQRRPGIDVPNRDDADWVDEGEEVDLEDLPDLENYPPYVTRAAEKRRKWESGWEALAQAFSNLDKQTDATMVLVALPPNSSKVHIINSRSFWRTPALNQSPTMHQLKASFRDIALHRRQTGTRIMDKNLTSSSSGSRSDGGSSGSCESNLRLRTLADGLGVLKNMYQDRGAKWNDEMLGIR